MDDILNKAIETAQNASVAFTKFITANDTGATGGHQAGFHIHKNSWPLFFDSPGEKGSNKDTFIKIKWQDDLETNSRFIYYGTGTRNEYRLTRFGRGFPFLHDENIGDLVVICKVSSGYYEAFILSADEDIDGFLTALNISTAEINGIIPRQDVITTENRLLDCFNAFIASLTVPFPPTSILAGNARNCYNSSYNVTRQTILNNPDKELLGWLEAEFQLFKAIENNRYADIITRPFNSVEQLIETANTILNRRKSRAGKSLEHHLAEVFNNFELNYSTQSVTEDNKKPDFLFPGPDAYSDSSFNDRNLIMLAAKTTCKDRWRQILNEADRIRTKHLFTLQQGISANQLTEMYNSGVCLVVPNVYINSFPLEFRHRILTLNNFIQFVADKQA